VNEDRPLSRRWAVAVGGIVALTGIAIVAVSVFAGASRFQAPRWVVGACGGAFVLLGGWTAAMYARGYDESRPEEALPSPWVQLAVLVPSLILLAAPFHWVAFGPGPRQFSGGLSIPFLSIRTGSSDTLGRIAFGIFAVMFDAILVFTTIRLVAKIRRDSRG
jgi:hypothetical protein